MISCLLKYLRHYCRHIVSEGGNAVWCVAFNFSSPQHHDIFAAVSGNKVSADFSHGFTGN